MQPAVYRIHVRGHLDPVWSTWFDNMTITEVGGGATDLTGPLTDQAALFGLIAGLCDLGATLPRDVDLLDLDVALDKLATIDSRLGDLVVLRFFGGMTVEEAAESLSLSPATVKRDWSRARAWLFRDLQRVVKERDSVRSRGPDPCAAGMAPRRRRFAGGGSAPAGM